MEPNTVEIGQESENSYQINVPITVSGFLSMHRQTFALDYGSEACRSVLIGQLHLSSNAPMLMNLLMSSSLSLISSPSASHPEQG